VNEHGDVFFYHAPGSDLPAGWRAGLIFKEWIYIYGYRNLYKAW